MKKSLRTGLRLKIFIPIFLLLLLLPAACWLIFASVSERYMVSMARRDLQQLTSYTENAITLAEEYAAETSWAEQARQLIPEFKSHLRKQNSQANMFIFSSKKKLIYPKAEEITPPLSDLYLYCQEILKKSDDEKRLFDSTNIYIGEAHYLADLTEIPSSENLRAQYFISYIPVADHVTMLANAGRLMFLITAAVSLLLLAIVWLIAGHLANPLRILCHHTERLALREFSPLEQEFSIREMEQLKDSINQMSRQLSRSDQAQNAFFQNVSHELRTPLMSICGYAQGIEEGIFPEPVKAAGIIASESLRLKELVDSILTISKIDNENLILDPCELSLPDFLEEVIERIKGAAAPLNVKIDLKMPTDDLEIRTDATLLFTSLQNILSNCLRYSKECVDITVFKSPADESVVFIQIRDDGPGISTDDLPHIFERFYKGSHGNYGIGLSLAKSSLEYMGGGLNAENKNGAVFTMRIKIDCTL